MTDEIAELKAEIERLLGLQKRDVAAARIKFLEAENTKIRDYYEKRIAKLQAVVDAAMCYVEQMNSFTWDDLVDALAALETDADRQTDESGRDFDGEQQ